jgi:hypothetical protein
MPLWEIGNAPFGALRCGAAAVQAAPCIGRRWRFAGMDTQAAEGTHVASTHAELKAAVPPAQLAGTGDFAPALAQLLGEVREAEPFKGENKTYQPFYGIDMPGWTFVRGDSAARFGIIRDALVSCPEFARAAAAGDQPTYVDVGCCSGFFCDAMTTAGFSATGLDVTKNFIDWAGRVARLKGQAITYICQDAEKFLLSSSVPFDVTSSFATIQWVMAQRGYAAGVNCFKALFERTRHVCIVEMGYSTEEIYKTKILDRPGEIDKHWVLGIMKEHGNFQHIEFYPSGERGIWRDIFIGYKTAPGSIQRTDGEVKVATISRQGGGILKRMARRLLGG